jgi:hypothetical protein
MAVRIQIRPNTARMGFGAATAVAMPYLRWVRDAVGILAGALILAWLVVRFAH